MIKIGSQSDNQDARFLKSGESEISLLDILIFLKVAYKTIAITSFVGLTAAVAYLAITPKQYVASAQIAMAQVATVNINNNNLNPLGNNIEEPSLLIARLSQPTSFNSRIVDICKLDGGLHSGANLAKSIKLELPKGAASVVELKTYAASPQEAQFCAQAIFELIKVTQAQIVGPYIEEAKSKLQDGEERSAKAKSLIAKADKSDSAIGAVYLSTRDEIRFLLDEIAALKSVVTTSQARATRLIAPIYASNVPVAPKKWPVLVGGLFGGLFLGFLIALIRQNIANLKNNMGVTAE